MTPSIDKLRMRDNGLVCFALRLAAALGIALLAIAQSGPDSVTLASGETQVALHLWTPAAMQVTSHHRTAGTPVPGRGLQDGWAVGDSCGVMFTPDVAAVIADSGAAWVRINFRLGASQNWTETVTCGGVSALDLYDTVVDNARAEGLQVLGLLSNESWRGSQAEWQANSAERNPGDSGDNGYLVAFSTNAGSVLFQHFAGRVGAWEIWNEPNAYTSYSASTGYVGSTFIYPSNFAWLLRHVFDEAQAGGITNTPLIAGGVFGHDLPAMRAPAGRGTEVKRGDPQTPGYTVLPGSGPASPLSADPIALKSGAEYLRSTYAQGIGLAGWDAVRLLHGSYPLDGIGQHLYVDQGTATTTAKIAEYLSAVRAVVLEHPEVAAPPTWVTEFGWTTASVSQATQAANLKSADDTTTATPYVRAAFWFQLRDIAAAGMYYGLLTPFDPPWTRKLAWGAFHPYRIFAPLTQAALREPPDQVWGGTREGLSPGSIFDQQLEGGNR
jgi:hypothetical protein